MSQELVTAVAKPESPRWGEANDFRGKNYVEIAVEFVKRFPVGTPITSAEFDSWAQEQALLTVPPDSEAKRSDAWLAHLQRRHQLRYNINKAGTHPRMEREYSSRCFSIDRIASESYEVRSPQASLIKSRVADSLASLCGTKKRQLAYLMQSSDWNQLPPHERAVAETVYDDIEMLQRRVDMESDAISTKLVRLEAKIKRAIESGEVKPVNGGLMGLLGAEPESE